jgi:hypothetical protein
MIPHAPVTPLALASYKVVTSPTFVAPPGQQTQGTVSCPAGTVPLGGGTGIHPAGTGAHITASFPSPNGWVTEVSTGLADVVFDALVVCAQQPRQYAVVSSSGNVRSGVQATVEATCPVGSRPLGGGVQTTASDATAHLAASLPTNHGWLVSEDNGSSAPIQVTTYAICGRASGYALVTGAPTQLRGKETTLVSASCPTGTLPLGGGASSTDPTLAAALDETGPEDGAWLGVFVNSAGRSFQGTARVVCARAG